MNGITAPSQVASEPAAQDPVARAAAAGEFIAQGWPNLRDVAQSFHA